MRCLTFATLLVAGCASKPIAQHAGSPDASVHRCYSADDDGCVPTGTYAIVGHGYSPIDHCNAEWICGQLRLTHWLACPAQNPDSGTETRRNK